MRDHFTGFDLDWSFDVAAGDPATGAHPAMRLAYAITAHEELYVADHLWDYTRAGVRVPDPYGVYRFVHEGALRLVFGQAPWPSNLSLREVYTPLYARVLPGETRRGEVRVGIPVDEYSSLARDVRAPTVIEQVSRVTLVLAHRLRSTLREAPRPPINERGDVAGYIVHDPTLATSTLSARPFAVKRRTGYIARFALPGEPPPGPYPL